MTDDEILELMEREYSNLDVVCKIAAVHRDPHEEQVLDFNRGLHKLIDAGLDFGEWVIPEHLIEPSYGQTTLPSGKVVPLNRVRNEQFFRRANPAMESLVRQINKRRSVQVNEPIQARNSPSDPSDVWVIYGRDEQFRKTIFDLLRTVGLKPIEFTKAVVRSGSGTPFVLDVVLKEIRNAPAIVSLLTPDDYAELREELRPEPKDLEEHIEAGYQPRPNVILETGMALAALRDKTILVVRGRMRSISDIGGLHEVRWDGTKRKRNELISRLHAMGSPVDRTGNDWLDED